jgi:hypothetical protein
VLTQSEESSLGGQSRRELELVDRVLGLEAEVARLSIEAGVRDLRILEKSRYWQVGRVVLSPVTLLRRLIRR